MRALLAIVRKDLLLFRTDRRAVLMQIAAPVLISAFFGFVFTRSTSDAPSAKIVVLAVDQDASATSKGIIAGLSAESLLDVRPATDDAAPDQVRRADASVAVVFPPNFGADAGSSLFRAEGKPEIGLLYDPSHVSEVALIRGLLTQHVMQEVTRHAFSREALEPQIATLEAAPIDPKRKALIKQLLQDAMNVDTSSGMTDSGASVPGMSLPYQVREEAMTAKASVPYNGYSHAFAGMSVQFILFSGINMGIGILLDKQRGVWKRLRAAPLSKAFVLGAKTASGTLIAFLTLSIVFAFAIGAFSVRVDGSVVGFVGVLLCIALLASTFGLLVATIGKTPEATRGISIFAVLIMVMLGGAWVPTFIFPAWLQKVTLVIPARWAVDGIEAMTWRGLPLASAGPTLAALLGFSVLFAALAVLRFDWESE